MLKIFNRWRPRWSLRSLLIIPFVIQLVVAIALTGYLSVRSGESAVTQVARQLRTEISTHIVSELSNYLAVPQRINRVNANLIDHGELSLNDFEALERHFWQQAQDFEVVDFIYYGAVDGQFAGGGWPLGRDRPMQRHRVRVEQPQRLQFFNVDATGDLVDLMLEAPGFDVTQRPWFQSAVQAGQPAWGPVFTYQAFPAMAIPAVAPVWDDQGALQGVFANNFFLTQVSDFLKTLKVGKTGQAFIFDREGLLVASSHLARPFWLKDGQTERMLLSEAPLPVLQAAAGAMQSQAAALTSETTEQTLDFVLDREHYFLQITVFQDEYGLDWRIGVIMPDADFLGPLYAYRQTIILLSIGALLISLMVGLYTSRWIARPVQHLRRAARRLAAGNFRQRLPQSGIQELDDLTASFEGMANQLQMSFQTLQKQAFNDALTQLPSRPALVAEMQQRLERAAQDARCRFAVFFIDLDNFKLINDSLGHLVGDRLLMEVAQRLRAQLPHSVFVSRFGGDEFVVVSGPVAAIDEALDLADQLLQMMQAPVSLGDRDVYTTMSVGIALSTGESISVEECLRQADIALYQAKDRGKARYEVFSQEMHTTVEQRWQIETALRHSLQQQQMAIAYQPVTQLSSGDLVGFEALCRWHHEQLGVVSPEIFIPIAEETGWIVGLERWLLHQACAQMQRWQTQFSTLNLAFMSVNISPVHVMHPTFVDDIAQALHQTQLSPAALKLEVTESLMMQNPGVARDRLQQIRALGVQLSLDDFGTGYSSLSYLHQFPFDTLKVDQSFVQRLRGEPHDTGLVRAIIAMAHSLNIQIIAEGIETAEEAALLAQLGSHYGQGYYFARPSSAAAMTRRLAAAAQRLSYQPPGQSAP
ncbi:EAL domain-containing protein [Halomicronema sp. CCY15110]|uniref:bifunctional diguanylate cyclase/phosphodiesterase n=1 Tax=Halomicronema sp. CCY15110 TaxID=2767773 RepID=UPI0019500FB7|nr:EAL domain-containing protein [Halomicronema sp. CCY15110]